jgi:hypothetical protein
VELSGHNYLRSTAMTTASLREPTPSFLKMWARCIWIVRWVMGNFSHLSPTAGRRDHLGGAPARRCCAVGAGTDSMYPGQLEPGEHPKPNVIVAAPEPQNHGDSHPFFAGPFHPGP